MITSTNYLVYSLYKSHELIITSFEFQVQIDLIDRCLIRKRGLPHSLFICDGIEIKRDHGIIKFSHCGEYFFHFSFFNLILLFFKVLICWVFIPIYLHIGYMPFLRGNGLVDFHEALVMGICAISSP